MIFSYKFHRSYNDSMMTAAHHRHIPRYDLVYKPNQPKAEASDYKHSPMATPPEYQLRRVHKAGRRYCTARRPYCPAILSRLHRNHNLKRLTLVRLRQFHTVDNGSNFLFAFPCHGYRSASQGNMSACQLPRP